MQVRGTPLSPEIFFTFKLQKGAFSSLKRVLKLIIQQQSYKISLSNRKGSPTEEQVNFSAILPPPADVDNWKEKGDSSLIKKFFKKLNLSHLQTPCFTRMTI